jgi:hypothetical protein
MNVNIAFVFGITEGWTQGLCAWQALYHLSWPFCFYFGFDLGSPNFAWAGVEFWDPPPSLSQIAGITGVY